MRRTTPGGKKWIDSYDTCKKCGQRWAINPDFTTPDGIHLLLREMMKREDFGCFFLDKDLGTLKEGTRPMKYCINIDFILIPGKLRDAALAFLKEAKDE
jgi:hypothetical protein